MAPDKLVLIFRRGHCEVLLEDESIEANTQDYRPHTPKGLLVIRVTQEPVLDGPAKIPPHNPTAKGYLRHQKLPFYANIPRKKGRRP